MQVVSVYTLHNLYSEALFPAFWFHVERRKMQRMQSSLLFVELSNGTYSRRSERNEASMMEQIPRNSYTFPSDQHIKGTNWAVDILGGKEHNQEK